MLKRPAVMDALEDRRHFDTLTAGVTVATAVNSTRPQKNWSINLTAGQAIIVAAGETTTSAFQPQLILITPNHKAIARSVGESGAFISKVAPVTGTYVVRIRDTDGTHFSGVNITAAFTGSGSITDGDDATTMQSGRRFAAGISQGDLDVWKINATGKQFMSIVANENTNGSPMGVGVAILGPDGAGVTAKESETGFAIDVPQVKAGTYYAVVYENGVNSSGRYGIALGLTPGQQTTEDPDTQTPLISGNTRTGDLPSGDIDLFQQTLAAGRNLTVTVARNNSTVTPAILLIDPNGNQVATASGSTTATLTFKTTMQGTYSILVRNRDPDTGGSYKLTYTLV